MSYAALMVHLDLARANDARLAVASSLAARCKAAVIGIGACDPQPAPYFFGPYGDQVLAGDRARVETQLGELGEKFRAAMADRAARTEWRAALASPVGFVARQARAADLVIAGGDATGSILDPTSDLDLGDLVMHVGRPVLAVPSHAKAFKFACGVVAWKDTRQAQRAVKDALPLLGLCRQVVVAAIEEDEEEPDPQRRKSAEDVAAWLRQHHIVSDIMVMPSLGDTVGQLTAIAIERDADFIVAGAYGYSRFSEWVFGGVTRDLLTRMPRCLLLAH